MSSTPFQMGVADAWDRGYGASCPRLEDLAEYRRGYGEGTKQVAAYHAKHGTKPFNVAIDAAGAIQHAVTVTRPDPTRAEMAMHIMAATVPVLMMQSNILWEYSQVADTSVALADALRTALDRKEAK